MDTMTQILTELDHTAMEGGGFYNKNSALQASGISLLLPLWTATCKTVGCVGEPLVVVDYASSQGRNSMVPMQIAVEILRQRTAPHTPVEVFHTDLPSNDFSALFNALQDDKISYMTGLLNVFPAAIGRNYFQPLFAQDRVHLGWNTFSMQWLSRNPLSTPDHVLSGLSQLNDVVAAVENQLAEDWRRFLQVRAAEMRVEAKLLTAFTGKSNGVSGWEWLCGELWGALQEIARDNLISATELSNLTIPIGFRTRDEIEAPFAASGHFAGLELQHIEYFKIPDPFWGDYQVSKDKTLLGQRHADLTKAWAAPTLMGLMDSSRNRGAVLDEAFRRFAVRITANPRKHEPWMAVAILEKTSG
jgi:SAM dependent carboxyl methyltransferase